MCLVKERFNTSSIFAACPVQDCFAICNNEINEFLSQVTIREEPLTVFVLIESQHFVAVELNLSISLFEMTL